jgi:hypothetical protein
MDTITVKIHEYDEATHSLIVSFATDASDQSVDESDRFAFNIVNYNPNDLSDTISRIAKEGAKIAHARWLREQSLKNQSVVDAAKAEVGKVYNYPITDLITVKTYAPPEGNDGSTTGVTIL